MYTLEILNRGTIFVPQVKEGIKWETVRKGSPGKLEFTIYADVNLDIDEGNPVRFRVFENKVWNDVFYGYIFKMSHQKNKEMKVTCYDQLRYFKNKDTYSYSGITAGRLLQRICDDFRLSCGRITDTGYVIPQRIESNKTLFDIMQNALDLTMMNTRQVYVLYDDYGKICLQNIADRKMNLILDAETGENYEYSTSIDGDTYNQVKLTYDNKDTGKREIYMTKDSSHINEWGVLQYYDTLNDGENGASKAEALLKYYNKVSRNFQVKDAFGDVRIRAGTYPLVMFSVSNYWLHNFMMVEKATHTFNEEEHTMTLTLSGGEFME